MEKTADGRKSEDSPWLQGELTTEEPIGCSMSESEEFGTKHGTDGGLGSLASVLFTSRFGHHTDILGVTFTI